MHNNESMDDVVSRAKKNAILGEDVDFQKKMAPRYEEMAKVREKQIELERLCYEIFVMNESGKRLAEELKERFLIPALCSPTDPAFQNLCSYFEGFKEGIRGPLVLAENHAKRIAGING